MALHKLLESAREAALKSVDGHLQPQALGEGTLLSEAGLLGCNSAYINSSLS
jgi:hypothetical protein